MAARFGRLDVLVNNAAISSGSTSPSNQAIATMRTLLATNVFGLVAVTQAAAAAAREVDGGAHRQRVELARVLKRAEAWTAYACRSAAAFSRAYLRTRPVPPGHRERSFEALPPTDPEPPRQSPSAGKPVSSAVAPTPAPSWPR